MSLLRSEAIDQLAEALAAAQGMFTVPQKKKKAVVKYKDSDRTYEYNYADLADIMASITPGLSKNCLALTQVIDASECRLTTMLLHKSGQFWGCTYDLPKGLAAQQFGSALTYARRYSATSLTGVVAEDDDDIQSAQLATERDAKNAKRAASPTGPKGPVVKPRQGTSQGGTAGPAEVHAPAGMKLEDILAKIKAQYVPYVKLFPNEDLPSHVMERYGATSVQKLTANEAWNFLQWLDGEIKKGLGETA